jgi:hypothetical protein
LSLDDGQHEGVFLNYAVTEQNNNADNNNNSLTQAQFCLTSDESDQLELAMPQRQQQQRHSTDNDGAIRLANKSCVRLVAPTSGKLTTCNRGADPAARMGEPPLYNQSAAHADVCKPQGHDVLASSSNGATNDLAAHSCDLQTDV